MKGKVLIIDDEVDLCLMLTQFLKRKDYDVQFAHTLAEGMLLLNETKPQSLLLDNNLPDGLGWTFAAEIHKTYPLMHITLISANAIFPLSYTNSQFKRAEKPISLLDIEKYL